MIKSIGMLKRRNVGIRKRKLLLRRERGRGKQSLHRRVKKVGRREKHQSRRELEKRRTRIATAAEKLQLLHFRLKAGGGVLVRHRGLVHRLCSKSKNRRRRNPHKSRPLSIGMQNHSKLRIDQFATSTTPWQPFGSLCRFSLFPTSRYRNTYSLRTTSIRFSPFFDTPSTLSSSHSSKHPIQALYPVYSVLTSPTLSTKSPMFATASPRLPISSLPSSDKKRCQTNWSTQPYSSPSVLSFTKLSPLDRPQEGANLPQQPTFKSQERCLML